MRRRGRLLVAVAGAALALGACQTMRKPKLVDVPPPAPSPARITPKPTPPPPPPAPPPAKSCVPRGLAPPPRYPDTDAALRKAPGAADRYQLLAAGRILREQRLDQLEAVVAGCR